MITLKQAYAIGMKPKFRNKTELQVAKRLLENERNDTSEWLVRRLEGEIQARSA